MVEESTTKATAAESFRGSEPGALVALARVVLASRAYKLVPLLLLLTNAALLAGGRFSLTTYGASVAFVFVVSLLGMQLNVLTDEALDRARKPWLMAWLTADPGALRLTMIGECALCAALLAIAAANELTLALGLVAYALCFTLYSYNFFVRGGEARARLKVFWWGNLTTVFGGYACLWIVGFALAKPEPGRWASLLAVALAVSCIDYGVFLNECAGDAREERENGLRTLPALFGARATSAVALSLLLAGVFTLIGLLLTEKFGRIAGVALLLHAGIQAVSAFSTLVLARHGAGRWEALVDSSFWLSRLAALMVLLGGTWISQ
jgi:4-hydroxybenzoate polyprenyltransferase